ncbi:H2O-forming NADH oxidase [Anaerosporobacter faecicola]|uniref:H2O-forming NADH oxidase n=1 Tax=Anaerosporobacter faecicola TaxID=2718714 RepID=UPI00143908E0|nr:FAD-dependent oxidoreductase [Anaerosporobacter faecicola]
MEKVVVVGANHAGTAAINTVLDNYADKEVIAFDANDNISFLGCGMALWIGKQIKGSSGLFYSDKDKLEAKGAKVYMETYVESVDYTNKVVHATGKNGKTCEQPYDKLILATGSIPIAPPIKGIELENVQFVKLFQNAQEVIQKLESGRIKRVVVVGAGYIGVELAEAFKRNGNEVTLIDMADTCLSGYYDREFTDLMAKHLEENGVHLAFGQSVKEIKGTTKVEVVVTDKEEFQADMVVLCMGFKPNNTLGKDTLELYTNGAFLVNGRQETSVPDVYAIGDCATVYDNATKGENYIALASNAVRSGIIAAHNACGTSIATEGVQGTNGISVFGFNMLATGLTLAKAKSLGLAAVATDYEDWQKPLFIEHGNFKVKIRIVYDQNTRIILGTQLSSDSDISLAIHFFSLAVQENVTIDKIKLFDAFFLPHFNQPYNYITMAALQAK